MNAKALKAGQDQWELDCFRKFAWEKGCRSYLEIGTRYGGCFYAMVTAMPKDGVYVAVDQPGAAFGQAGSDLSLIRILNRLRSEGWEDVHAVFGNSHDAETIKLVKRFAPFDLIFIDADHELEAVTADWKNYRDMGRLVAFHDIAAKVTNVQVPLLWREIRKSYKFVEFVNPHNPQMGIGVIFL